MADISKEQLSELVSRVTNTVAKEMQTSVAGYGVADLRAHVTDLGKIGDNVAWEISYKTSKVGVELDSVVRPGAQVAWEISYKTSKAGIERGTLSS